MIAFALVLLLGSAAGWIAVKGAPLRVRSYLRLASVLYATLAVSVASGFAEEAISDIVTTLGAALLGVAAFTAFRAPPRIVTACALLAASAFAGIIAAATGFAALAAVPQVASAVASFLIARRGLKQWKRPHVYLALASVSLLGVTACHLSPGVAAKAGLLLFAASGLLGFGLASDVLVEQRQKHERRFAVGRAR